MSWGSSWGNSGWSSSSSSGKWGQSSWGDSGHNKDPEGEHNSSCIAGSGGWGKSGLMSGYYDEKCSGCRHDRAKTPWGSTPSGGGNPVAKMLTLFGAGYVAKKSLWD